MDTIHEKTMDFKSNIKVNFQGGNLTSDSGLLLYKEFDEKIGFSDEIIKTVNIKDNINHRKHENEEVICQKIYQNSFGYHADSDANHLKHDEAFKVVLDKNELASQPTISRVNTRVTKDNMKETQQANFNLLDKVHKIKPPDKLIFDLDSTNSETYGDQFGVAYNSHYSADGYHPLLLFDGNTGDGLKAELRAGNVYTSRQVVRFIGPVLKKYNKKFKSIPFYLRADSGFAKPGLYKICEVHNVSYTIRLKANSKLYKLAAPFEKKLMDICEKNKYDHQVLYNEILYKAGSWEKERKVIVKIEKPKGQLFPQFSFIVTNIKNWAPEKVFNYYCQRSTMENFIKEAKNGFAIDKMSSTSYWANANKLQQMLLAYNLNNWLRRLCFPKNHQSDRIFTIRKKIMKIAAKVIKTGRYIYFKLASSCPYKKLFMKILDNIQKLEFA